MRTLDLQISEELGRFLDQSGEPERVAVRLLEEAQVAREIEAEELEELRAAIAVAREQIEQGEFATLSIEDIIREENERFEQAGHR